MSVQIGLYQQENGHQTRDFNLDYDLLTSPQPHGEQGSDPFPTCWRGPGGPLSLSMRVLWFCLPWDLLVLV